MGSPARALARLLLSKRRWMRRQVGAFARGCAGLRVLEIGSGKAPEYSVAALFEPANTVVRSDARADYGHLVVDVTRMGYAAEFDVVVCLNVLEHVYDFTAAVDNIHAALRPGGTAVVAVPYLYPLHDEPHDYWRFSEHALRRMFKAFERVSVRWRGLRQLPLGYVVLAVKQDR